MNIDLPIGGRRHLSMPELPSSQTIRAAAGSSRGAERREPGHCARWSHWLSRPLCCRYDLVQVKTLRVAIRNLQQPARWHWALGTHASKEFEVLGAWPLSSGYLKLVLEDLAERGVERNRRMCVDEAVDHAMPVGMTSADHGHISSSLQVCSYASAVVCATQVAGGKRRAPAVLIAERLHDRLVRAVGRRAPFANEKAAETFIAQWLERADRSLDDLTSPTRRMVIPAKALPSPGAMRASTH